MPMRNSDLLSDGGQLASMRLRQDQHCLAAYAVVCHANGDVAVADDLLATLDLTWQQARTGWRLRRLRHV